MKIEIALIKYPLIGWITLLISVCFGFFKFLASNLVLLIFLFSLYALYNCHKRGLNFMNIIYNMFIYFYISIITFWFAYLFSERVVIFDHISTILTSLITLLLYPLVIGIIASFSLSLIYLMIKKIMNSPFI